MTLAGLLTTTNGQIAFPAAANSSAGANTLDDYEEGTFTPALTCVTPGDLSTTYLVQLGSYVKIGRSVQVLVHLQTSSWVYTTASGNVKVTGMPFASNSSGTAAAAMGINTVNTGGPAVTVAGMLSSGATEVLIYSSTPASGGTANVTVGALPSGATHIMIFQLNYEAT